MSSTKRKVVHLFNFISNIQLISFIQDFIKGQGVVIPLLVAGSHVSNNAGQHTKAV